MALNDQGRCTLTVYIISRPKGFFVLKITLAWNVYLSAVLHSLINEWGGRHRWQREKENPWYRIECSGNDLNSSMF
jgi:hypothetical protein